MEDATAAAPADSYIMRVCSLGSGSAGNAHVVETQQTTLLIDCGFSYRALKKRLVSKYLSPAEIDAVLITHEHTDHVHGLNTFLKENKTPCYLSAGTARKLDLDEEWQCITAGKTLSINDIAITPVPVPHDVAEPLQFVFDCGGRRLAMFMDLGHASPAVIAACREVDVLMVECNYQPKILADGFYPETVKERIRSPYGHLSNADARQLIEKTECKRRHHIVATHLSENNNNPQAVASSLQGCTAAALSIATQADGFDWIVV